MTLFKCQGATDCSQCLAVDQRRKCGWCTDHDTDFTCKVVQGCALDWIGVTGSASCPKPKVTKISPKKGPVEGGTRVTIVGSDLGVRFSDISSVTIGGIECRLREEEYSPGKTLAYVGIQFLPLPRVHDLCVFPSIL